ncbi:unnamed protein product [Cylicocyclus nassatus]|uniref:Transmembrane and coiled-coil domain-containing protein 4-like n=1 Tax=Cylicocyclus nassatus TaxID=53992 RepID=A0AA36H9V4_CYLNA|nr:unnamed protein product [Cylicocyclus nassatus]
MSTPTTSSPTPLIREGFPLRSSSNNSLSSVTDASPQEVLKAAESLQPATRFALADLSACLLRLDFWDDEEPGSIFFSKLAFEVVVSHLEIPDKVIRTIKTHLEGEEDLPDLVALITTIKNDPLVSKDGTMIVLSSLLIAFVNSGNYDSRYRVFLRHLSTLLCVVWNEFENVEDSLASTLVEETFVESNDDEDEASKLAREKTQRNKKIKRYLLVGAAGGVGGVLIGLTGGLAAPLVAAGAGAIIGTAGAAGIATTAGAAVLGTTFGVAGAGLAGYKMSKRVGAIEEFAIESLSDGLSLHCALVVSGWIDEDTSCEVAFEHQWRHLNLSREQYSLRYESKYLIELGKAMNYIMSIAVSVAIQQTLMETALAGLLAAVAWPVAILSCASVLDNPWNVCIARAAEVGEQLAEVLLSRSHGKRPISLVGFSLGARVIYHCLLAMSKRSESAGIIEDVILLGAPVSASSREWDQLCTVVGGRIINGYCETDWLLRFLYRTMSVQFTIAGTGPVDSKNKKIFNYNLSHIVKGHLDYSRKLSEVLAAVGISVKRSSSTDFENAHEAIGEAQDATTLKDGSNENISNNVEQAVDGLREISVKDKEALP